MPGFVLSLFGKHPAWSDHMFAATDVAIGKRLKQSFYDLSVVPTVQSSAYDPEFDQHFYVILEHGHVHIIAATKSTDSVGRSRFPLFAALSIEREDAGLLSFDALQLGIEWLRVGCLKPVLQGDITDDVDEWQGRVNNTIQELSQQSPIAGIRKDESAVAASDWMSAVNILMHKEPGFSYQEANPVTRPALMEACRLQFKNPKAVLWIGHTANPASGCFLISNISGGFAFDRWLAGSLQQLTASDLPISGQLRKAARQYTDDPISLSPSEWPVFGLRDASSLQLLKQWLRRYKVPVCVVLAILFLSVATGLLFAYALPERDNAVNVAAQVHGFAADPQQLADWQRYTRQYVDWILPLKTSVQLQSGQQLPHPVDDLLSTELNPFSVLGETSVRMDLVENPSNRVFLPANQQALSRIYGNQDNLSHAMTQLLSRMAVADSVVTVGSDPMIPIVFTSWKTEDFATIPEPGVGFDQNFLQWLELHEALKVVLQAQTYVRDSILVPLSGVSSAAAEWLQHEIGGRLANVPNPQAAMAVFDDLEGYLKSSDWNNLNRLTPEFDPAFVEWKSQQAGNLALDSFMALLSDFMLVEFEEVQPLLTRLPQRVATFDARLSAAQRDFPTLQWQNDEERFTVNQALAEVKRYGEQLPLTRQQMRQLHLSLEEGLRVLDGVEARFERQFLSLEDPVNWLNAIRLEFAGIESEQYRTAAIAFAERLVRHHANDESAELTSQFGRFIADARTVLTFFRPLTSHEYGHSNPDVQNYFSQPGAAQRFRAEFVRKVASFDLSLEPADLKSQLGQLHQDLLRDLNSYLENVTSVGRSYLFMNATVSSETLRGQISAIADHRLHDEAILPSGTMLGVLHSDSTNPTLSDPADAYWALAAAMDKDSQHLGELMAAVTVYLNTLPAPSIASGFDSLFAQAFDTLRKALQHRHDFDQWIAIFGNPRVLAPDSLIPFSVQQSQRQIQLFEQYMALRSDQIPDAFTIRSKAEQADSQEMRSFLTGLSDLRTNTTDLSLEVNLAKRAAELPHIVSMTPGASPETVSVLFTSLHQPVAFQIIGLGTRRIMVQVEPFTYPIFLRLLARDPTEFEVFYYEVDKLQPLPFSPSMEPRVIPRPRWQFVGEASLALPAFDSPDSMPLFVMVPKMARLVAESLGMRLPHTDELPAIFANSTPTTAAVSFSSEERRLLMSHSRQFSVYKDKIQSPSDLGGLDFVRNRPSSGIIGLHGGAAELAWDGNQFYAAGGSWLWYQHNTAQQPVRITSELDPYIDLSFRLVTEAPPPGFQEALPIFMQTVFQNSGR